MLRRATPEQHSLQALYSDGHYYCVLCGPLLTRVLYVVRVRVWVCVPVCICVLEPHIISVFSFFLLCLLLLPLYVSCLYHTAVPQALKLSLGGSHGTRAVAVAHQVPPFMAATDGASVCAFACHVSHGNEHLISREAQISCEGGWALQAHTSSRY